MSLRVPAEHYRIGTTKVFMRREIIDKLEEERSRLLVNQARTIQVSPLYLFGRTDLADLAIRHEEARGCLGAFVGVGVGGEEMGGSKVDRSWCEAAQICRLGARRRATL